MSKIRLQVITKERRGFDIPPTIPWVSEIMEM
jgi:hypothetical protein